MDTEIFPIYFLTNIQFAYYLLLKVYGYMNEVTKKKISLKLKGKRKSATHIKHIKQSLIGRKLSKEHKEHISQSKSKNKPQHKE